MIGRCERQVIAECIAVSLLAWNAVLFLSSVHSVSQILLIRE